MPSLPAPLELAQAWVPEMGREVRRAEHIDGAGRAIPVLLVAQGTFDLTLRLHSACVAIALVVEMAPETQGHFALLPSRLQRKAFQVLQAHLFQQPRTSLRLDPPGARTITVVERLVVEQVIRISTDDPSSFNRLADALQEVASAAAGAFSKVGALVEGAGDQRDNRRDPPPTGMYA